MTLTLHLSSSTLATIVVLLNVVFAVAFDIILGNSTFGVTPIQLVVMSASSMMAFYLYHLLSASPNNSPDMITTAKKGKLELEL